MQISLFLSGFNTIIGVRKEEETPIIKTFESSILFRHPKLFKDRLLNILNYHFGIQNIKDVTRMVFSINGDINYEQGYILHSYFINNILRADSFNGFSFKDAFGAIIGRENVYVINDVQTISLGIVTLYPAIPRPLIVLYGAWGMGVSYINVGEHIITSDIGMDIIKDAKEFTLHKLIGKEGIEQLILNGSIDVYNDYTRNFILACDYFIPKINEVINLGNSFTSEEVEKVQGTETGKRNVFIWSTAEEYLKKEKLAYLIDGQLVFPEDELKKNLIPIIGCFHFPEYKEKLNANIQKIEYYSGKEKVYTFDEYEEFAKHWKSVHTFANPDNEYKVFYQNKALKVIKMKELGREEQLLEYKF